MERKKKNTTQNTSNGDLFKSTRLQSISPEVKWKLFKQAESLSLFPSVHVGAGGREEEEEEMRGGGGGEEEERGGGEERRRGGEEKRRRRRGGGGGLSWQQSCPGNSSVPMVTPPKFPGEERGNRDKNMAPVLVFSCRKLPLSLSLQDCWTSATDSLTELSWRLVQVYNSINQQVFTGTNNQEQNMWRRHPRGTQDRALTVSFSVNH